MRRQLFFIYTILYLLHFIPCVYIICSKNQLLLFFIYFILFLAIIFYLFFPIHKEKILALLKLCGQY